MVIWSRDDVIFKVHKTLIETHTSFDTLGFAIDYNNEYKSILNANELGILLDWLYSGLVDIKLNLQADEIRELMNYCNKNNLLGLRDLLLERVSEEDLKAEHSREYPEYKAREIIFKYRQEEIKRISQEESKQAQMQNEQLDQPINHMIQDNSSDDSMDMDPGENPVDVHLQHVYAEGRRRALLDAIERRREEGDAIRVVEEPVYIPPPTAVVVEVPVTANSREIEEKRRKMLEALEKRS